MKKIATPQDLQAELQRLLAYCESPRPSREKLAGELWGLADRVAANPKAEVSEAMSAILEDLVQRMGRDEWGMVLEAAKFGVFRYDGGDRERLLKLKQTHSILVSRTWGVVSKARHGDRTNPPLSQEAAKWFADQTDNVQFTIARRLIMQEAQKLGIKLDRKKLL